MANTEQLGTSVSPEIHSRFCAIAAERNLSNASLLRDLATEFLEAYDAGRAMFQSEAAPRLDASVSGLVHQLRELVIELDRAQAENARLFGKLIADWNGGEEAGQLALKRIMAKFREQDAESLTPFHRRADELLEAFSTMPRQVSSSLEPQLAQISEQLGTSIELASKPREIRAIYLGDDRTLSLAFLSGCAGLVIAFGVLIGLMLPGISDGWSASQANRLIAGPAQMCRVVNGEYGTDDCLVPQRERDLGLRIIAREDRR